MVTLDGISLESDFAFYVRGLQEALQGKSDRELLEFRWESLLLGSDWKLKIGIYKENTENRAPVTDSLKHLTFWCFLAPTMQAGKFKVDWQVGTASSPALFSSSSSIPTLTKLSREGTKGPSVRDFFDRCNSSKEDLRIGVNITDMRKIKGPNDPTSLADFFEKSAKFFNVPAVSDVVFRFKGKNGNTKTIWTSSFVLEEHEYFQPHLSEQYAELHGSSTTSVLEKDPEASNAADDHDSPRLPTATDGVVVSIGKGVTDCANTDDEDSDSDAELERELERGSIAHESDQSKQAKFTIELEDFSYRTCMAVLFYLYTGSISFAPLRSTFEDLKTGATNDFPYLIDDDFNKYASKHKHDFGPVRVSPCVTSPKSVYRIADKWMLPNLKALARQQYFSSLSPTNIIYELRSSVVAQHPELREILLGYLRENWATIAKEGGFRSLFVDTFPPGELRDAISSLLEESVLASASGPEPSRKKIFFRLDLGSFMGGDSNVAEKNLGMLIGG